MITIEIIIVNYNTNMYITECLKSINQIIVNEDINIKITIVDNNSKANDLNYLKAIFSSVKIIYNQKNIGFAAACNQGASKSKADYLLFLNPDTQLLINSLVNPIHFMEKPENNDVGILGIQLINETENVSRTCVRFPKLSTFISKMIGLNKLCPKLNHFMVDWEHNETKVVDQVMGAYLLTRRSVFERLGGFDERFFVYFEELDLSLRANKTGYKSIYFAEAQAFHEGCGSAKQVKIDSLFYYLRSQIIYGYKHFGRVKGMILLLCTLVLEPVSRIIYQLLKGQISDIKNIIISYIMLFKDIKNILKIIKEMQ